MENLHAGENTENSSFTPRPRRVLGRRRRIIYNSAGLILTGVGIVGIIVPILPTTVFLILASALFIRSNPRIHRRLHANRVTGPYLAAYTEGKGLSRRQKLSTIIFLWAAMGISGWIVRDTLWAVFLLAGIGAAVTIHVAAIKRRKMIEGPAPE